MSHTAAPADSIGAVGPLADVPSIPFRQLLPWVLLFGTVGLLVLFFVTTDQGAISLPAGNAVHEWVHDGRHLLGYPCH